MNQHMYQVLITTINYTDGGISTSVVQFISEIAADNCVKAIKERPQFYIGEIEVCRTAERLS